MAKGVQLIVTVLTTVLEDGNDQAAGGDQQVRRRRSWSTEEKVAILEAAFRPGGSVAAAADRFDVSRALIYLWRKQVRAGLIPGVSISDAGAAAFAPVAVVPDVPAQVAPASSERPHRGRRHAGLIEVRLVNGRTIRADECINPAALARIAAALDGTSE